jgi:hypothetical protein
VPHSKLSSLQFKDIDTYAVTTVTNSISTSATGYTGPPPPEPAPAKISQEEILEKQAEAASSIENLIADYMPDADKDVPRILAIKVVEALWDWTITDER